MKCLYNSDYGPADPSFHSVLSNGELLGGFEAQGALLSQAQNRGQLEAMERRLQKGEAILWCDQGYGWVEQPAVRGFFEVVVPPLILLWIALRLMPRAGGVLARLRYALLSMRAGEF